MRRIASNPQNTLESVMMFGKRNSVLRRSSLRVGSGTSFFPEGEGAIVLQKASLDKKRGPNVHHKLARGSAPPYACKAMRSLSLSRRLAAMALPCALVALGNLSVGCEARDTE